MDIFGGINYDNDRDNLQRDKIVENILSRNTGKRFYSNRGKIIRPI